MIRDGVLITRHPELFETLGFPSRFTLLETGKEIGLLIDTYLKHIDGDKT